MPGTAPGHRCSSAENLGELPEHCGLLLVTQELVEKASIFRLLFTQVMKAFLEK